jgi:hypothetical protein
VLSEKWTWDATTLVSRTAATMIDSMSEVLVLLLFSAALLDHRHNHQPV